MPKLSTRHTNADMLMFSDFTGGLNLSRPPESLADNEMQVANNFEFAPDTGQLRVRQGISMVYDFKRPVTDIIPVPRPSNNPSLKEDEAILVRSGDNLSKVSMYQNQFTVTNHGSVSGDKPASYELWGEGSEMVISFGRDLYHYKWDGSFVFFQSIDTEGAPKNVEFVFVRNGRVVIAESGSDTIRYSGLGDITLWKEDKELDSVSVSVGYKDGCRMRAIAPIAGELIIFKCPDGRPEWGRMYRLKGDYPNWEIIPFARGSSTWNSKCVVSISADLLFLTREGMGNLGTATEYGDFKLGWAGKKVNPTLSPTLTENSRMWHLPLRGQVWISSGNPTDKSIWVYHYQINSGAWTRFEFSDHVSSVADMPSGVYIGMGTKLFRMSVDMMSDSGTAINASWMPKTTIKRNQVLVKGAFVGYQSKNDNAELLIEGFRAPLPSSNTSELLVERRRCAVREWKVTPEIKVVNSGFSISFVGLDIAEV